MLIQSIKKGRERERKCGISIIRSIIKSMLMLPTQKNHKNSTRHDMKIDRIVSLYEKESILYFVSTCFVAGRQCQLYSTDTILNERE